MRYGRLVALLVILSSISLFIGVSNVQLSELLQLDGQSLQILLVTRLPRTICLILVGATSSICGLIMQHLTQNKFVSPTTAGTMDSARLGILVAMIFLPGASLIVRSLTAFCFCRNIAFFIPYAIVPPEKSIDASVDWSHVREYHWFSCYFFCLSIPVGTKYDFMASREFCNCDTRKL